MTDEEMLAIATTMPEYYCGLLLAWEIQETAAGTSPADILRGWREGIRMWRDGEFVLATPPVPGSDYHTAEHIPLSPTIVTIDDEIVIH